MFELVEESLDEIAFFVEIEVARAFDRSITLGRDDDLRAGYGKLLAQMIGVVALVGDGGGGFEAVDEIVREGDVVALAGRADQADGIAERVAGGVDFCAQAAAGAAKALGIRAPFFRRAPAAC